MMRRILLALLACVLTMTGAVATASADPGPVTAEDIQAADACYTWNRTLSEGASGEDVRQLQIRVAGYPGHDDHTHVAARSGQFWSAPSCGI